MISVDGGKIMRDLGEVLSIEDCYDRLEVASVDAHNSRILAKRK